MDDRDPARLVVDRFGDRALLVRLGAQERVHSLASSLAAGLDGDTLLDVVPGDRSLLVEFDGTARGERAAREALAKAAARPSERSEPREHEIPVRYGGRDGPDLREAARLVRQTPEAVVEAHTGRTYTVLFLGFAPGFAYLGDLDPSIVVPRLAVPRTSTPAGAVAIAERYTGIYPADLPGGWRVIGRTEATIFDPAKEPPTALRAGDRVRFVPG